MDSIYHDVLGSESYQAFSMQSALSVVADARIKHAALGPPLGFAFWLAFQVQRWRVKSP